MLAFFMTLVMTGFFIPIRTGWMSVAIKTLLFLIILVSLYRLVVSKDRPWYKDVYEESTESADRFLLEMKDGATEEQWMGFGGSFREFTFTFLNVIQNAVVGSSAALYFKKSDGSLELQFGVVGEDFIEKRSLIARDDMIYSVLSDSRPAINGRLSVGASLAGLQAEVRSSITTPIFIDDEAKGVLPNT